MSFDAKVGVLAVVLFLGFLASMVGIGLSRSSKAGRNWFITMLMCLVLFIAVCIVGATHDRHECEKKGGVYLTRDGCLVITRDGG